MITSMAMVREEVVAFIKGIPPFQYLDDRILQDIYSGLLSEFYPKGSLILKQDGPASDTLRIIKKGGVKVYVTAPDGDELLIDYRGEGDTFGFLSLIGGQQKTNVNAVEDTICYLIDKKDMLDILKKNTAFTEYFLKSHTAKYFEKAIKEIPGKGLHLSGGEKMLFTTPVMEIATRNVITAHFEISVQDAAEIMSRNQISSIIVVDNDGVPVGIVTDRDLRDKVVAKGRSTADPIRSIMGTLLVKTDSREFCFDALLKMVRYNIHHLLVVEDGRLEGIVTNHDLLILQGSYPISIVKEIETQITIEGLVPISGKINKIIGLLLSEGARASNITRIITEINDRLLRKVLDIAEKKLGPPPVGYCWIVFGSEGRKEQTFKTDQDNAIIYSDDSSVDSDLVRRYFSEFTAFVRDSLLRCGFPPCPANYMASNTLWCQPLSVWKKYFYKWINEPTPEAVLKSLIFFDFRPIHGDFNLAEDLKDYTVLNLRDQMIFFGYVANYIIKNVPPVGFFGSFSVEKNGEHRDQFNLKIKGLAPIVDIVRFFCLERGVKETSTLERIDALKERHGIAKEYAEELTAAFEFIMLLRIKHQVEQIEAGVPPDNFLDPDKLSNLEKKTLKDAFGLVTKIQSLLIERYKPLIW